jgi:single-strand DNA-binding protein
MNQVSLQGRIGNDPELRSTKTGKSVVNFRLATTSHYQDEDEVIHRFTDWHTIVVWGEKAELAAQFLKKGSEVYVEGSLRSRSYETEHKEGRKSINVTRYVTEVVARNVIPLGQMFLRSNGKEAEAV